jgi:hypothetical protein
MTCHELREALVDHARGVLTGAGSQAAIENHLEYCRGCAIEHARQRALTEGLRAVAKASASESAPAALEGRLLAAFAAQHVERQPAVASGKRRGSPWLAAAASIAIVVGLSYVVVNRARPEATEVRLKPDATNEVEPEATEVRLKPDTTNEVKPDATEVRLKPDATNEVKPDVTNTKSNRGTRGPSTSTPRAGLRIEEFVALPGAIGLPTFESGRIVRVDIPVSSLPAYGVELVPDAVGSEVQADVIVGQDGQARAIRFVTTSSSRSGVRP